MSAIISEIKITCREQEDWTGSDDVNLYIGGNFMGTIAMESGQTKTVTRGMLNRELWIEPGQDITFKEFDLADPSDVLVSHTVTQSEIDARTLVLNDTISSANYTFRITFVEL